MDTNNNEKREQKEKLPEPDLLTRAQHRKQKRVQAKLEDLSYGSPRWREELGRNVRGIREAANFSQLRFASKLIWPVGTLAALERGELTPSDGQQADIVRVMKECDAIIAKRASR